MSRSKDTGNLKAIQNSIEKIFRFSQDLDSAQMLYQDEVKFDAIMMNFIIVGESAARLTNEFKEKQSLVPWQEIVAFRNIVAHNYFGVDPEEVFDIVKNHLPALQWQINKLIEDGF
ncbi:MAG TPA: nucleotidyltransferase [Candidatus Riflebacteria bacterium]|nr:nucleotidyltransferase [Candidatus Riflebacteria bacterium]